MEESATKEPNWIAGVKPSAEMLTMSMTQIYELECREQPARLADLFRAYSEDQSVLVELRTLQQFALSPGPVLFIAMGASYCSSIAASAWLQSHGRSAFFADAGEWLHYSLPVWDQVAATVLVTASGESAELVQLCRKNPARPLALVCNNSKSPCWSLTQHHFPMLAGPEYGNATKTYTNATAACVFLASRLTGQAPQTDSARIVETYSAILARVFSLRGDLEHFCRGATNIELVGRGPSYAGALMGALCIREMAGKRVFAHTGAGFRHGPILDVNSSHLAIIFALGRTADLGVKLAHDCNARGGKVLLVSTEDHHFSDKLFPLKIDAVPEPWEALTSVLVPQAITLSMIELYGANLRPRFHYGAMHE